MVYDTGLIYSADRAKPRTMAKQDIANVCTVAGWVHDNAEPVCIVMAESSGKTDAVSQNPDGNQNIGLFQIDTINVAHPEYLKDPVYNANVARRMWKADGETFAKRWATAGQCGSSSGNVPISDEADAVGIGGVAEDASRTVQGAVAGILNGIPWFRVGKGALGFILVVIGVGTVVVVIANKAPTPIKAVKRAVK